MFRALKAIALLVFIGLTTALGQRTRAALLFDYDARSSEEVEVIYPPSIEEFLFMKNNITRYAREPRKLDAAPFRNKFSQMKAFGVRDFKPPCVSAIKSVGHRNSTNRVSCYESHPSFFSAVQIQNKLYVFGREKELENLAVFNRFVEQLELSVNNKADAEAIIQLFVYLNSYRFKLPNVEILKNVNSIPELFRRGKEQAVASVKNQIEPLKIRQIANQFEASFFMWEPWHGSIKKWELTISDSGLLTGVAKEVGKI